MYSQITFVAVFLMCLLTVPNIGRASECAETSLRNVSMPQETYERMYKLVDTYVSTKTDLKNENYCIELNRQEGNSAIFWIIVASDEADYVVGGGKSFEVHVDQNRMKIIKEMYFQ